MPYKNREDRLAHDRRYSREHPEYAKLHRAAHLERYKELAHLWYKRNKEKVIANVKKHSQAYRERRNELNRKRRQALKIEVLTHYSNGKCACVRCGFDDLMALSIDHIEGGGAKHRREIRGLTIYYWLTLQGFPSGYQVLCMNCQF
ncbi:hypothetical protein LCGC14_0416550, partial [marine sediment metagenome]